MKKTLFLMMLAVCFTSWTYGQTEKGRFMIDPSISLNIGGGNMTTVYNSLNRKDSKETKFGFYVDPSAAYFIADNLAIGIGLLYDYDYNKDEYKDEQATYETVNNYHSFGLTTYAKYYFGKGKLRPFAGLSLNIGKTISITDYSTYPEPMSLVEEDSDRDLNERDYIGYSVYPGVAYFLNDHISFDLMLKYRYNRSKWSYSGGDRDIEHLVSLGFGVSIFF